MERWAKLFEANGRQVLITKDVDDDDKPKLSISIRIDGAELTLGPVFGGSNGDELLDKAFNSAGQEVADTFTEPLVRCESVMDAAKILMARN
ncbi:hypothetical protein DRC29_21175 [Salmonella enterica]|nr:hypothetical protein [Salmonella enterica]EBJ1501902.1 hypothetical protein [Salmonella enterica]EGX5005967.1 hypothetical protein [Salmonella enterica]